MKANILHVGVLFLCFIQGFAVSAAPSTWVGIELERGRQGGVGIRGVVPGSPAAATDLAAGDEVMAVDEAQVHSPSDLQLAIAGRPVGRRLKLRVRNPKGALRDVTLAPAARPSEAALARAGSAVRPRPSSCRASVAPARTASRRIAAAPCSSISGRPGAGPVCAPCLSSGRCASGTPRVGSM